MAEEQQPLWQQEVEKILRSRYQGDELSQQLERADELVKLTQSVEIPPGVPGLVISQMLKIASEELRPLIAVYAGFQLGVAWEKHQNADRA